MSDKEIYLTIKRDITKNLFAYDDQMVAIANWIANEFVPKSSLPNSDNKDREVAIEELKEFARNNCREWNNNELDEIIDKI